MRLTDTQSIARAVRSGLTRDIFAPATSRLLWIPVHVVSFLLCSLFSVDFVSRGGSAVALAPVSLLIGMNFAGLAFVAHEALHGALVRQKFARRLAGWLGFLPFWVSPRLWIAWHNNVHHGNTNISPVDPDAYPRLSEYQASKATRLSVDLGAPRGGRWRGLLTLAVGFTIQSTHILLTAKRHKYLTPRHAFIALIQTGGAIAFWTGFGAVVGGPLFLVLYVAPLMIGNSLVMAHIITNHSLSPLSHKNDALETSLSVSVPRWFEFYSLGFGYHVEHHLFPAMSNRHAPAVQRQLKLLASDRYQCMPLTRALKLLFTTPRVYLNDHTLIEPSTGSTFQTVGPTQLPSSLSDITPQRLPRIPTDALRTVRLLENEKSYERISSVPPPPNAA